MRLSLVQSRFALNTARITGLFVALAFGSLNGLHIQSAQAADIVSVQLDQARIIKLPPRTQTLIIGNPVIADVTMLKSTGLMIITGKGFGDTNLIALDETGEPLAESIIRVSNVENALVVQRGLERQSYSCAPRCQPTIKMGDTAKFVTDAAAQIKEHNSLATGK